MSAKNSLKIICFFLQSYPRRKLRNIFKMKRSPKLKLRRGGGGSGVERKVLLDGRGSRQGREEEEEEEVTLDCVNSWLLSIFVKVFD